MSRRKPASTVLAAVIYLRCSTTGQAESGLGREAQEALCRAHAERLGWPVAGVYLDDGLSGTRPLAERPGLAAAVAAVKATPGTAFLVASVSRVSRTQRELWRLVDDRGEFALPLVSASEPFDVSSAMGRAFLGMLATFASLEADLASERTVSALAAAKARGQILGAPPMGVRVVDGVRVEDAAVVASIARARALRAEGKSYATIAAALNEEGAPTAKGGRWHVRTVRVALGVEVAAAT